MYKYRWSRAGVISKTHTLIIFLSFKQIVWESLSQLSACSYIQRLCLPFRNREVDVVCRFCGKSGKHPVYTLECQVNGPRKWLSAGTRDVKTSQDHCLPITRGKRKIRWHTFTRWSRGQPATGVIEIPSNYVENETERRISMEGRKELSHTLDSPPHSQI